MFGMYFRAFGRLSMLIFITPYFIYILCTYIDTTNAGYMHLSACRYFYVYW